MNKQDLVSAFADASGLTKADAGKAVEATFEAITHVKFQTWQTPESESARAGLGRRQDEGGDPRYA